VKTRINIEEKRVDWSVNFLTTTTNNMNNSKNVISSVLTEQLKSSLIERLSSEYASVGARLVYQLVNEAYALASATFAPLLLLPVLAEEKVQNAAAWSAHQDAIFHGNPHRVAA
jgi:Na+(H+)/acetate symporter ActP